MLIVDAAATRALREARGSARRFVRAPGRGAYWPDGEHELLLKAALLTETDALEAWQMLRPRFDADRADRAAKRLLPLLGANLRRHGVDDPVLAASVRVCQHAASRNRALFDAGRGLLQALAEAGIDTLVLKGFVMGALEGTSTWRQVALNVSDSIVSSKWISLALKTLWHHPWLIAWLVMTLWLALAVDRWLDRMYSQFSHHDYMRLKLRKALGLG